MISSSMFSFRQYPFSPPHQINNIRHLFLGWQARKRHRSLPSLLVITNISYEGCSRHSLSEKAAASKSRNCIISQGKLGAQSYTSQRNITPWRGHCGDRSYRIVQIHLHKRRCTAWKNERFFSTSSTHIRRITNNHSKVSYEDYKHCMSIVEQRDFDAYLCGLLLPSRSQCQYTFYATRALNVEVASIKDGIDPYRSRSSINSLGAGGDMGNINSSNLPSKIRMQWWRDAIEQIYSSEEEFEGKKGENGNGNNATTNISNLISESSAHHPVIRAVSRSVRKCNLTRRFLDRIIDARDVDLDIDQLSTVQELVDYAEETASSLLYLSLEGSGTLDTNADWAASNIGVASGIVTALRSTAYRAARRSEISIPAELMRQYLVPSRYLLNPPDRANMSQVDKDADSALRDAVQNLAMIARSHLSQARAMQGDVPKLGRLCLLPAVSQLHYLDELEKLKFDVLHPTLNVGRIGTLKVPLLLGRAWLTGYF